MGGYILNKEGISRETERKLYRTGELELMTTHQLREICRRERIIQGILNPLDKEELVSVITVAAADTEGVGGGNPCAGADVRGAADRAGAGQDAAHPVKAHRV